jgi:hypothetical protein
MGSGPPGGNWETWEAKGTLEVVPGVPIMPEVPEITSMIPQSSSFPPGPASTRGLWVQLAVGSGAPGSSPDGMAAREAGWGGAGGRGNTGPTPAGPPSAAAATLVQDILVVVGENSLHKGKRAMLVKISTVGCGALNKIGIGKDSLPLFG